MAKSKYWMDVIAQSVRDRAMSMTENIASNIKGSFASAAPPAPTGPSLDEYMQMPGQVRQAYLQSQGPNFGAEVSRLQNDAVSRFGAMASVLAPMFNMDAMEVSQMQAQHEVDTGAQGMGVAVAHEDLANMLGIDPFSP